MTAEFLVGVRLALRAKFGFLSLLLIIAVALGAMFGSIFSARQPATVSLDVGISLIRIGLPLISVFLVQELLFRDLDRKYFLCTLTYPRSRTDWFVSRLFVIAALLGGLAALSFVLLGGMTKAVSATYDQASPVALGLPFIVTGLLALVDLLVVTAVAAMLAVAAKTGSFVIVGSLGFLVIARSFMGVLLMLIDDQSLVQGITDPVAYTDTLRWLSFVFPDLWSLDARMITLYGKFELIPEQWKEALVGSFAYSIAAIAAAALILKRRELS